MRKPTLRHSDVALAIGLLLAILALGVLVTASGAGAARWITAALLVAVSGILLRHRGSLRESEEASRILFEKLMGGGGEAAAGRIRPLEAMRALADRLERFESETVAALKDAQRLQERRIEEISEVHTDLLTHHRITKKMLHSHRPDEVFETLLSGVREGLGFPGAVLGIREGNGDLVFREDAGGRELLRIPAWDHRSLLARALWNEQQAPVRTGNDPSVGDMDAALLGEGPALIVPISRGTSQRCFEAKHCDNDGCPAFAATGVRCWIAGASCCSTGDPMTPDEKRKECVRCDVFSPAALLVLRERPGRRRVDPESARSAVTLAHEAAMALELVDLYDNMRRMSVTDGLTGLTNHREFYHQLKRELERARRYNSTVSVLIIDVDDFKKFNDRFGHIAGDVALKRIAEVLRRCSRGTDLVARYGGEEFSVILPESDSGGALMLAERIKTEISNHNFMPLGAEPVRLTVSIGIFSSEGGAHSEDQIVSFADEAAYRAKFSGKNRVVLKTNA